MAKRAVCVGINNFKDTDINALRGCVNDARNISQVLLRDFGFDPNGVRVLTNQQATKRAYLEALEWLVTTARPGDELVLYTSTHGSHIPDKDGDEDDGEDEVLVIHDHDWETNVLTDDEIAQHIAKLPRGVSMSLFWDTCHSGTMEDVCNPTFNTRDVSRPKPQAHPNVVGSRYLEPPAWLYQGRRDVKRKAAPSSVRATSGGVRAASAHIHSEHGADFPSVSVSGCDDDQTSADASFGGVYEGAFTHCLLDVIRKSNGDLTWEQLHQGVAKMIKDKGFDQVPQVHVPTSLRGRPAFGGRSGRGAAAGVTASVMSADTSSIDQQIMQFESAGRWADAASALQKRVSLVSDPQEQARTLEHLVSVYRAKLGNEALAIRTTEALVEINPGHKAAVDSLRQIYAARGDHARLQALDAKAAQHAGASRGILGNVGASVSSALGTAGAAISTAAGGVFTAVTSAPVAYEQPTAAAAPKPPSNKCPYCAADHSPGARTCSACGGSW